MNDIRLPRMFTEMVQRPGEHGIGGSNLNDGIPACLQWALDETPLQHSPKQKRMHVAPQSKQVCPRTSSDKGQLTATTCVSRSGEVVCMQIITREKIARSHADIPPGRLLHDAMYQEHIEKKVQTRATFERLLRSLAQKASRIREHHHLPEDSPVIINIDWVASLSQEALTPIKEHLHQCKDHPSPYIFFGRKTRSHISSPPDKLINLSMRRFVRLLLLHNMVKHGMRIHNKEICNRIPLDMSETTMKSMLVQWVGAWCKET